MEAGTVGIVCRCCSSATRTSDPEEEMVHDLNLWIVGEDGLLENRSYWDFSEGGQSSANVSVIFGRAYSVFAIANAGYRIDCNDVEKLKNLKLFLSYPDNYAYGIPMSYSNASFVAEKGGMLVILLEKMMGKVNVRMDRSRLRDDVTMNVGAIRICNCPRCVSAFRLSKIEDKDESFAYGFCRYGADASKLNTGSGLSGAVSLYALENMQGNTQNGLCSYVEMEIDYFSDEWYSSSGKGLIYRFLLNDGEGFNIQRNCCYNITVTPREDGLLTEDSWKVDRSGLVMTEKEPYMMIFPQGCTVDGVFYTHYYEARQGDSLHFTVAAYPKEMEISLREDLVLDELEVGHARYIMDSDGKGFSVKGLGRGLSMMEIIAGTPLNDSESIAIEFK